MQLGTPLSYFLVSSFTSSMIITLKKQKVIMLKTSNILDWETFWTKSSVSLTTRNVAAAETSSMYVFGCLFMCPHISFINRVGKKVLINCSVIQHIFIIIDVGEMELGGEKFHYPEEPTNKISFSTSVFHLR